MSLRNMPRPPLLPHTRRFDALDRYWDRLVTRDAPDAGLATDAVDPAIASAVRSVHSDAAAHDPDPDPVFLAHLLEDVMRTNRAAAPLAPLDAPWNSESPLLRVNAYAALPAPPRRGWWPASLDALAAGLVLLLVAGIMAGNGRLPGRFVGQTGESPPGETAMLLGDAARSGAAAGPLPSDAPTLLWEALGPETEWDQVSPPVVADGVVYAVRERHEEPATPGTTSSVFSASVVALDLTTGVILWETTVAGLFGLPPVAVADGAVFVMTRLFDRTLVALDAGTGDERWAYDGSGVGDPNRLMSGVGIASNENFAPAVAAGVVYVGSPDGALHAVDAASGTRRWAVTVPGVGTGGSPTSPAIGEGLVYVANNQGTLYAYDAATGAERWTAEIGGNQATTPVVADEAVFIGAILVEPPRPDPVQDGQDGNGVAVTATPAAAVTAPASRLVAVGADDGVRRWARELDGEIHAAPVVAGNVVVIVGVGAEAREARGLGTVAGAWKWTIGLSGPIIAAAAVVDDVLVVGSISPRWDNGGRTGDLFAMAGATGAIRWGTATSSGSTAPPLVVDGMVVIVGADGLAAYAVDATATPAGRGDDAGGTPAATDGDTGGTCDIAPMPPVVTEAPPSAELSVRTRRDATPATTPAASVAPVTDEQAYGDVPGIAWKDLPVGSPADAAAVSGVMGTLRSMNACAVIESEEHLAAYYSDDFYRRAWVRWKVRYSGYFGWSPGDHEVAETIALPDGRVAAVLRRPGSAVQGADTRVVTYGYVVVFVADDGRWLVDELIEVSPSGDGVG